MKKQTMRRNWLQQSEPTKFFEKLENKLIESSPIPGQEPGNILNPKQKK